MEAVRRGEEWALPARDRGAVKALARDYVDSKRRVSEYYMYGLVVLLVLLFIRTHVVQTIVPLVVLGGRHHHGPRGHLHRPPDRRPSPPSGCPGRAPAGVGLYSAMRALQIRKLRMPKPRVKPGDTF